MQLRRIEIRSVLINIHLRLPFRVEQGKASELRLMEQRVNGLKRCQACRSNRCYRALLILDLTDDLRDRSRSLRYLPKYFNDRNIAFTSVCQSTSEAKSRRVQAISNAETSSHQKSLQAGSPPIRADVFLSHSHKDEDAVFLAIWVFVP